jgi:hypothetical protein
MTLEFWIVLAWDVKQIVDAALAASRAPRKEGES